MAFRPLPFLLLPSREALLLLRAAFGADDADARRSFALWRATAPFDDIGWEEQKVLARLAPRLDKLSPGDVDARRIRGLAKAHWARTQLMLRESIAGLDAIIAAGVPAMVLKGAALTAMGETGNGPRISSDLDVMVPRERFAEAVDVLLALGWTSGRSANATRMSARFTSGVNLRSGQRADIDTHHQPVASIRIPDVAVEALWRRAIRATFVGRPVVRPSTADMIAISAAHGLQRPPHANFALAWMFDIALLLDRADFDGRSLAEACVDLRALAATRAALTLAQDLLGHSRDYGALMAHLPTRDIRLDERVRLMAGSGRLGAFTGLARRVAFSATPRRERFERESTVIRRGRQKLLLVATPSRAAETNGPPFAVRHCLRRQASAGTRRLHLALEIAPGDRRRRYVFDVSINRMAIARLRGRCVFRRKNGSLYMAFSVPLPRHLPHDLEIELEALPPRKHDIAFTNDPTTDGMKRPFAFRPIAVFLR
jgi:hypothetical protein